MIEIDQNKLKLMMDKKSILKDIAKRFPVAVLSTESKTEKLSYIFGPDVSVEARKDDGEKERPEMEIFQLAKANYGIRKLRKRKYNFEDSDSNFEEAKKRGMAWPRLLGFLKDIVEIEKKRKGKTLIVSKAAFEEDIVKFLKNNGFRQKRDFKTINYYGQAGSNRFQDCNAVVLFGGAYPDPEDVSKDAAVLLDDHGEYTVNFAMRLAGLREEELSEGEMRDAIHRIRPYRNLGRRAYIISGAFSFKDDFKGIYREKDSWAGFDKLLRKERKLAEVEKAVKKLGNASTNEIREETGIGWSTAKKRLKKLEDRKRIESFKEGQSRVWKSAVEINEQANDTSTSNSLQRTLDGIAYSVDNPLDLNKYIERIRENDEELDKLLSENKPNGYNTKQAADKALIAKLIKKDFSEEEIRHIVRYYRYPRKHLSKSQQNELHRIIDREIRQTRAWLEEQNNRKMERVPRKNEPIYQSQTLIPTPS